MKKRYIISIVCLIGFIVVTALVCTNNISGFDNLIYNSLFSLRCGFLDFFFMSITYTANVIPIIIIALIICFIYRKNKCNCSLVLSSLILSVLFNQVIKHIICRARPDHLRLVTEKGYSFPSGHSMIAVFLYGTLMYILIKGTDNKKLKILYAVLFTIIILLIGLSRIYVGVHYPSDVLGGYLLSVAILIVSLTVINYHFKGE